VAHLQVGEVAVSSEVVADFASAAGSVVGSPADGHGELGRLVAAEEEGRAVEEDLDPAPRTEELQPPEDLQPVDAPIASEAVERALEADAHSVRRELAEILDDQEQQPAFELDVKDDVRVGTRMAVLRGGSGHVLSLIPMFRRAAPALALDREQAVTHVVDEFDRPFLGFA